MARDPERRNFVLLVEPLLAPLRAALADNALPPSWHLQHEVTEDRRRQVEIVFTHASGSPVRLRFAAPGRGSAPVISTQAYDVDAEADLTVQPEALRELLEWLHGKLAAGLDASAPVLAVDAVDRAVQVAAVKRGRQRVTLLTTRLRSQFSVPGWRLDALHWPDEKLGELVARGSNGDQVVVRFTLSVRGNRSQLGVDFQLGAATDEGAAKTVVTALVALLRAGQSSTAEALAVVH